jgi:flagellar biogenesis protein FliO
MAEWRVAPIGGKMQTQPNVPETKKKKSGWDRFFTFLSMGGFLLVIFVGAGIVIAISSLIGC